MSSVITENIKINKKSLENAVLSTITTENTKVVRDLLENAILGAKNEIYLRYEKDDTIYDVTYGEFAKLCRKIGIYINDKKDELGRQVKVGIIGNASVNCISILVGVMGSGNIIVPMDQQLDSTHLADLMNRSDVDILFYDIVYQPFLNDLKNLSPNVKYITPRKKKLLIIKIILLFHLFKKYLIINVILVMNGQLKRKMKLNNFH